MHRLFVALPVPEDIADLLLDVMEGPEPLRWVAADHLHLTLRFIGEVDGHQAEDIAAALEGVACSRFGLSLKGVGTFVHRRHGALWAGVSPREPVAALAAKVERALHAAGVPAETRAFHPHVTLARWSGATPDLAGLLGRQAGLGSPEWPVTGFDLVESRLGRHGAVYDTVAAVALV